VVRLAPPLTISDEELDHGLDVLCEALGDLALEFNRRAGRAAS